VRWTVSCDASRQNVTCNTFWNMLSATLCQFSRAACITGCSIVMLPILAATGFAEEPAADSAPVNSLRPGAIGIEFGVNSLFSGGFSGTLSGKWHMGSRTALRLGAGGSFHETQTDGNELLQDPFQTFNDITDEHEERRSYSAFAQIMQYFVVDRRIGFFVAPGPVYQWTSDSYTEHVYLQSGDAELLHFGSSGWAAGLDVDIGVEWFFHNRLSLGARYGVAGLYGEADHELISATSSSDPNHAGSDARSGHDKSLNIQTESTLLTLTGYF
jgi:hypothetical protein